MAYNPNAIWTGKKKNEEPKKITSPQTTTPGSAVSTNSAPSDSTTTQQAPITAAIISETSASTTTIHGEEVKVSANAGQSFFKRHSLAFFCIGIAIIFAGVATAAFYLQPVPKPNVAMTVTAPDKILVGVPTVISVSSANNSNVTLTGAVLTIVLPDGMSFVGDDQGERNKEYPLGDIETGAVAAQSSTIVVTGNPDTQQRINVQLTYNTPTTAATEYETDSQQNILIGDSAISLSYTAPSSIFSGQPFPITVNYQNNNAESIPDAQIQLVYPPAFTFGSSSIATEAITPSSTLWDVGTLAGGQTGSFTLSGTIVGPQQAQYAITGTAFINTLGQNYSANVQTTNFALVAPPLAVTITPNNSANYISSQGDSINYVLTYTNNSNITFPGVNISAALVGQMFDFSSLQTSGAFNSQSNVITWYAANTPALKSLAPGASGQVTFTINTKSAFPIKLLSDKNYLLKVTGTIQSATVLPNAAGSSTVSVATIQNKVGGQIAIAAKGYLGSGTYPPKVNMPTTYNITWAITNYATDAQNVTVSAYLQSGTTFVGTPSSSISTAPIYDPSTGLITWTIPSIAAGTGVADAPIQATFQVSNTPAVNQVGQDVTLIGKTTISSTDAFTGKMLSASALSITTALPDDPKHSAGEHHVSN